MFYNINDEKYNNFTNREKIKKRELINKQILEYLKTFYVSRMKKYLSSIKNGIDKTNIEHVDLSFSGDEQISIELQSEVYQYYKKMLPFMDDNVRQYFMNIDLKYTNSEIKSIYGIDNIYNSTFEKIKYYSDFNFNDAYHVVLYIIIEELNNMIKCSISNKLQKESNTTNELMNIDDKNIKCKYICNYILLLFEDLESDKDFFVNCKNAYDTIKNSLEHDIIEYKVKEYYREDKTDFLLQQIKVDKGIYSLDYLAEENEKAEKEYLQNMEENDREYYILEKGKKELYNKFGYEPSDEDLNEYKEKYLSELNIDQEIENDENNYSLDVKKDDVIDQGADYGSFNEYDFETGDGFDYSAEQDE